MYFALNVLKLCYYSQVLFVRVKSELTQSNNILNVCINKAVQSWYFSLEFLPVDGSSHRPEDRGASRAAHLELLCPMCVSLEKPLLAYLNHCCVDYICVVRFFSFVFPLIWLVRTSFC